MLESGRVEAVVCVQSQEGDALAPKPVRVAQLGCGAGLAGSRPLTCTLASPPTPCTTHVRTHPPTHPPTDPPHARTQVVARTREEVLAARGVKPSLSPNLNVLATVEALQVKRLLFIGVGCQVRGGGK